MGFFVGQVMTETQGPGEPEGRERGAGEQAGVERSCATVIGTTTPGGAVRRTSRILVALVAMTVLVLGLAAPAPAVEPHREIDLSRAMNTVDAMGCRAYSTGSSGLVYLEFDPTDREPWEVEAKAGFILEPGGNQSPYAFLVVPTTQTFPVAADGTVNGQKRAPLSTVSLNMGLPALPEGDGYWPGDYVRGDLEATIDNIDNQGGTVSEEDAQAAVWSVTDGLDVSGNPTAEALVASEGDGSGDGGTGDGTTDGGTGDGGTTDGGTGDVGGSGSGGARAPSRATVPPASAAAAGIVAAGLAAGAAAIGGGLSGLGSTAGAAGGGGSGGSTGMGTAPARGAPGGAAGTAAPPQDPYQPAQRGGMAPDGPAGTGAAPSAPPTPPPQQPGVPPPQESGTAPSGQPQRQRPDFPPPAISPDVPEPAASVPTETEPSPPVADDVDIDRGLYDPDYAGSRATPDPGMGVEVDPDTYDPWAAQRNAGHEAPASIGPAPKDGDMPDITISPETGDYGVDFGGRGVRISKNRDGWNVGVGDRGVGPMDAAGVPDFDAAADGFSVSNRGGTATIGIGDPRGGSATIALDKGEGLTTVTIGDQNDRTIIKQVRDRYGVGRQFGSGQDPSRTIAGEYDTETGDFAAGQRDRRGSVIVAKEDDTVAVGWSSARGKPGPDDDFTRQISVDRSTGDFGVDWGKVSVSRDDDVFSVGSGKRGISWDTDTDSGILTFGPSDGSRQTTMGGGDGSFMAATRIPTRIGGQKIDIDVMVNTGMRVTANEDMMPELLTGGSEEYWVGIKHDWLTIRGGRVDDATEVWFTINKPLF